VVAAIADDLLSPAFFASLATLIAAVGGLVAVLRGQSTANDTNAKVTNTQATQQNHTAQLQTVITQTNGVANALQQRIDLLEQTIAEMRALGLTPHTVPLPGGRRASDSPAIEPTPPAAPPTV
jgi:hypothetical protein